MEAMDAVGEPRLRTAATIGTIRRIRAIRAIGLPVAALLLASAAAAASPSAADRAPLAQADARGQALYDARCAGCHDRSVHQRAARMATNYAAIRASVERWDRATGGSWREDEVEAVTRHLNERYYRFPCTGPACAGAQASIRPSGDPTTRRGD